MKHFADIALPPVLEGKIVFHPAKYVTTYRNWLENIQDWCISRQLWWGHRIPAYFLPVAEGEEEQFVVALTPEEALEKARKIPGYENITLENLARDEDALDTWFSSWLWPISLFDGINNPGNNEIKYYYPTNDLVTGPDIIFFWVARMIMAGEEYLGDVPFSNVYFTGIVRDKIGRKMSKQLGNSPDPLELIAKYGADAVRLGMLLCSSAGNDILYDDSQVEQGRNFCGKMWNAFRLVQGWKVDTDATQSEASATAVRWFGDLLVKTVAQVEDNFSKFRISDALMAIYKLFWDEFCAWYLEIIKPAYGAGMDRATYEATLTFFDALLKLIHPFMPFITEELWQNLDQRREGETIMLQPYPAPKDFSEVLLKDFALAQEAVAGIRNMRQSKGLSPRESLRVRLEKFPSSMECVLVRLANVEIAAEDLQGSSASFMVGTSKISVDLSGKIDLAQEKAKLLADLEYQKKFLSGVNAKLGNENFVAHAPEKVVAMERKKQSDALERIAAIEQALKALE